MGKPGGKTMGGKKLNSHTSGRRWKERYATMKKDIDQIDDDLNPLNAISLLHQRVDLEKPGDGQHYCIHCAIYFINKSTLSIHLKTKAHKKRVKELKFSPHTQEEADRAAGMGNFIMPEERIVRNLTADDQVRDPAYLKNQHEELQKDMSEALADESTKNKKEDTIFIPVKSRTSWESSC